SALPSVWQPGSPASTRSSPSLSTPSEHSGFPLAPTPFTPEALVFLTALGLDVGVTALPLTPLLGWVSVPPAGATACDSEPDVVSFAAATVPFASANESSASRTP